MNPSTGSLPFEITPPPAGGLGCVIEGFDLRRTDTETAAVIKRLVYEKKLLVFRGQRLETEEYLDVARRFGRPQVYFQSHYHHPEHPEIFVSSNVKENGEKIGVAGTGRFWHTDYSFFDEPLSTTMVYPQVLPRGRKTFYIDMERVLASLPDHLRRTVEGRKAFHEATYYYKVQPWDIDKAIAELMEEFRRLSPGAVHPMVIRHPVTGARSLYVSRGFTTRIMDMPHEESRAVLDELFAFVERPEHIHAHVWEEGDILYWDNRPLIHKASEVAAGDPSVSFRIGVYDGLPFHDDGA